MRNWNWHATLGWFVASINIGLVASYQIELSRPTWLVISNLVGLLLTSINFGLSLRGGRS